MKLKIFLLGAVSLLSINAVCAQESVGFENANDIEVIFNRSEAGKTCQKT